MVLLRSFGSFFCFFFFFLNDPAPPEISSLPPPAALPIPGPPQSRPPHQEADAAQGVRRLRVGPGIHARAQDRKSTRLNSSHGYISYAVFCLKKKKKTKQ